MFLTVQLFIFSISDYLTRIGFFPPTFCQNCKHTGMCNPSMTKDAKKDFSWFSWTLIFPRYKIICLGPEGSPMSFIMADIYVCYKFLYIYIYICLFFSLCTPYAVHLMYCARGGGNIIWHLSAEVETPTNFCPSRFSQVCSDLHFLQIANLDTHTCPDFLKCVQILFFSKTQI